MKWLIALLLTCSSVLGQGFGSFTYDQPFLAKTPGGGDSIPTPTQWWVASDLPTNTTVEVWTNRITTETFARNAVGKEPTNSALWGVTWNASGKYMVGTNATMNITNDSFYVIFRTYADSTWQDILIQPDETGLLVYQGAMQLTMRNMGQEVGLKPPAGQMIDFVCAYGASGSNYYWTNGVFSCGRMAVGSASGGVFSPNNIGGSSSFPSDWLHGSIAEIAFFRGTRLTTNQVALIHQYATNKWQYSP